jgi:hypothetical protein
MDRYLDIVGEHSSRYHDGTVTRVDEQPWVHLLLLIASVWAIPHITHLLWIVWLHHALVVGSAPFRAGWFD